MSGELREHIEDLLPLYEPSANKINENYNEYDEPINSAIFDDDGQKKKIYSCDLCNIQVTSINVLRRHKEGRKHIMRVERQGKTFSCELCEIIANSQSQLDAHLRSSKHKARLTKRDHPFRLNRGAWILIFCCFCIIINFILLYKVAF